MIYSGFLFFNELDLLRIKLEETRDLDIKHILVQCNYTFSGKPKEMLFERSMIPSHFDLKNIELMMDKPDPNPWLNEQFQRNSIMMGLHHLQDDDIFILSDVDEIVKKEAIEAFKPEMGCAFLVMDKMLYYLNVIEGRQTWNVPKICTGRYLRNYSPDRIRNSGAPSIIMNAGWHFSYAGGHDSIMKKAASFSHQEEEVQKHLTSENIKRKLANIESLWSDDKLEVVEIDDTFPRYVRENKEELQHLIYKP